MAVFKNMLKKFLGFEEEEYAEENPYEEFEEEEPIFQDNTQLNMVNKKEITLYPKTFGDACEVIEQLESGNTVIINMENIDIDTCKRISDFVLGAVYVLDGDVEKLSKKVFRFWTNKN